MKAIRERLRRVAELLGLRTAGDVFAVIPRVKSLFMLFVVVNLIIGSLGFTAPLLITPVFSDESFTWELLRQMRAGGAYTFSLAFLASAASFVIKDYLEYKDTSFRGVKSVAIMLSVALGIVLALLSGVTSVTGIDPSDLGDLWSTRDTLELFLFAVTVILGVWLFCLEHLDRFESEFARIMDRGRQQLIDDTQGVVQAQGFKA